MFSMMECQSEMSEEFKEIIKDATRTGILYIRKQDLQNVLVILESCGNSVNKFIWQLSQKIKISQEDLMNLLNLMPKLRKLKLRYIKLEEDKMEENPKKKLKLNLDICKNLKSLDADDESFINFFSLNFADIFRTKISLGYKADYENLIKIKSPQNELIKNLKVDGDELKKDMKEVLKFPNLEEIKIREIYLMNNFIKEISTLENLKSIKFRACKLNYSAQNWKCLESLRNLEELSFKINDFDASFLRDLKLKSLRKLSLKSFTPFVKGHDFIFKNLSINSPNLKVLKVNSSLHKINFYAKHFKNLEKLHLKFVYEYTNTIELDTGIVNECLKEFKIKNYGIKDEVNDLLEIVEIFPNLESIEINWYEPVEMTDKFTVLANKFLFSKLNKLKNLKSLKTDFFIPINRCLDFIVDGELIDDLKNLSKKLEICYFSFELVSDKDHYDFIHITKIEEENFKLFVSCLREFFEVARVNDYSVSLKK